MISLIYKLEEYEDSAYVEAIIEDAVQIAQQTLTDPAEYGPAVCSARFVLDEGEKLPEDDDELIEYLESLNLDWEPLPKDWDD